MSRAYFRRTAIVGLTTLLSRITGLMRDVIYASMVPALALEAFVLASQIPNLLRRLFAERVASGAVVAAAMAHAPAAPAALESPP